MPSNSPSILALNIAMKGFFAGLFLALAGWTLIEQQWNKHISLSWLLLSTFGLAVGWCVISVWLIKRSVGKGIDTIAPEIRTPMIVIQGITAINSMWWCICWYGGIPDAARYFTWFPSVILAIFSATHLCILRIGNLSATKAVFLTTALNVIATLASLISLIRHIGW